MPRYSYALLDKEDTGFVYVLLFFNFSRAKSPVFNARRYTSADEMSVVVASRQCVQVCCMRGLQLWQSQDVQASAQGVPPSTIPDSVDDESFCMMANRVAFESALGSAAAATAARFKQWGQPAAVGNDTAVDVSACVVRSVGCNLRFLTVFLLSPQNGKAADGGLSKWYGESLVYDTSGDVLRCDV